MRATAKELLTPHLAEELRQGIHGDAQAVDALAVAGTDDTARDPGAVPTD